MLRYFYISLLIHFINGAAFAQLGEAPAPNLKIATGPSLDDTLSWIADKVNTERISHNTTKTYLIEFAGCDVTFWGLNRGNDTVYISRWEKTTGWLGDIKVEWFDGVGSREYRITSFANDKFKRKWVDYSYWGGTPGPEIQVPTWKKDLDQMKRIDVATPTSVSIKYRNIGTIDNPDVRFYSNVMDIATSEIASDVQLAVRVGNAIEHGSQLCREERKKQAAAKTFVKPVNEPF